MDLPWKYTQHGESQAWDRNVEPFMVEIVLGAPETERAGGSPGSTIYESTINGGRLAVLWFDEGDRIEVHSIWWVKG